MPGTRQQGTGKIGISRLRLTGRPRRPRFTVVLPTVGSKEAATRISRSRSPAGVRRELVRRHPVTPLPHAPASACAGCPEKARCTPHDEGRHIYRPLAAWTETDVGRFHQWLSLLTAPNAAPLSVIPILAPPRACGTSLAPKTLLHPHQAGAPPDSARSCPGVLRGELRRRLRVATDPSGESALAQSSQVVLGIDGLRPSDDTSWQRGSQPAEGHNDPSGKRQRPPVGGSRWPAGGPGGRGYGVREMGKKGSASVVRTAPAFFRVRLGSPPSTATTVPTTYHRQPRSVSCRPLVPYASGLPPGDVQLPRPLARKVAQAL
jgi:hypothetical protein